MALKPAASEALGAAAAGAEVRGAGGAFSSLRIRNFRLLWIGNLFAGAAQWIQSITLNWLVYELTGSGALLGSISFARNAGTILFAPFAGVWADRVNRRRYMMGLQLFQCVVAALMGLGLGTNNVDVWHIFVFASLLSIPQALLQPVQSTLVFEVVPRHSYTNAIALNSGAMNLMQAFGPSLAGLLIAGIGTAGNFYTQSAAYGGVVLTLALIAFPPRVEATDEERREGTLHNFAEGVRYVRDNPTVRLIFLIGLMNPLLLFPMIYGLLAIFAKDVFHTGPGGLGLMASAYGAGGLLGAIVVASLPRMERPGLLQIGSIIVAGLALLGFAHAPSIGVASLLIGIAGICGLMFQAMNQTVLQLMVPTEMRGRISSLFFLTLGLFPVANVVFGGMADLLGAPLTQSIAASIAIVVALGFLLLVPRLRNLRYGDLVRRDE